MTLKLSKALVQIILVEEDENGEIIGEHTSDAPNVLYGMSALRDFVDKLPDEIKKLEE